MEWLTQRDTQKDDYNSAIETLAEMVERYMAGKRFIVVRKPKIDVEHWVRRQMLCEDYNQLEYELTAKLLGMTKFTTIA